MELCSRETGTRYAVAVILLGLLASFLLKGYRARCAMHKLLGPGAHSWAFGHLKALGELSKDLPHNAFTAHMGLALKEKYNIKAEYIAIDSWPFGDPTIFVLGGELAQQVAVTRNMPKHRNMADYHDHLSGPGALVGANGAHWKRWRTILNPGFAANHLVTLVPLMLSETKIFVEKLTDHAEKQEVFRLEEDTNGLTMDVIGQITAQVRFNAQRAPQSSEFVNALKDQMARLPLASPNPLAMWSPYDIYRRWRNTRTMNRYIGRLLDERFDIHTNAARKDRSRARTVIDLALESYLGGANAKSSPPSAVMDAEFRKNAITQIRMMIFGGEDTSSTTISYALYELSRNPSCLAQLRQEHTAILGSNPDDAADIISRDPRILNRLPYTHNVIMETLRLWAPAGSVRTGNQGKDMELQDPKTGEWLPTAGISVAIVHIALGRNPDIWGSDATEFNPSRFQDSSKLPPHAFRPFEHGPRACIGKELVLLEIKLVLALVARQFDFAAAYDSLDELLGDESIWGSGKWRDGNQDFFGDEAYPVLFGAFRPREGMPMRVRKL